MKFQEQGEVVEAALGPVLVGGLVLSKDRLGRRQFLLGAGLGTYLLPVTTGYWVGQLAAGKSQATSTLAAVRDAVLAFDEGLHPEIFQVMLTVRNLVFAQKWSTILRVMRQEVGGRPPEVAQILGSDHEGGVLRALRLDPAARVQEIDKLLSRWRLHAERKTLADIARLDYLPTEKKWAARFYEDPLLAQIR